MKVLNVAEKNDAAKNIANILSSGKFKKRDGFSVYNKIYEFSCNILGRNHNMCMTSVSGHLLNLEFVGSYKKWGSCNPISLFDAPVKSYCPPEHVSIKDTLEKEAKSCFALIIWTDCDREGENIGFEIINVCKGVKPDLQVYRATFSEITPQSIRRAANNLGPPNEKVSLAVEVRKELDLRIGAAFTRLQTLRLQRLFPEHLKDSLISYGSCQFPTLGFVVERYKAIQEFITEPFWKIKVTHSHEVDGSSSNVDFLWKRGRLFEQFVCQILYEMCLENPLAKVISVTGNPKNKWRPTPLDTIEFEKLSSKKLKIPAKEAMRIAEKLYSQGYISYPRTETNIFPKDMDLNALITEQCQDREWGEFAQAILGRGGANPRQGKKSDKAHPPLHPIKWTNSLAGNEKKVYDLVSRHFLACCDEDAKGHETKVTIKIQDEEFLASGLCILELNYLKVYPYEKWNAKFIPNYQLGETFTPDINLTQGETSPPSLLTEADLITLMEKHGIGTDATHAEHIETIKSRSYVGVQDDGRFLPGQLGMGLVEGYDSMGIFMSKPDRRRDLELSLVDICEGTKDPQEVLSEQVAIYKELFRNAVEQVNKIDEALAVYLGNPTQVDDNADVSSHDPVLCKCPQCQVSDIILRIKSTGSFYLSCMSYPHCRSVLWLPEVIIDVQILRTPCPQCHANLVKLKFKKAALRPYFPDEYETCINCDSQLLDMLDIDSLSSGRRNIQDSGFESPSGTGVVDSWPNTLPVVSHKTNSFKKASGQEKLDKKTKSKGSHGALKMSVPNHSNMSNSSSCQASNEIKCQCGVVAVLLTVKKDGPNKGRKFHRCADNSCNFFQWEDVSNTPQNNPVLPSGPSSQIGDMSSSRILNISQDDNNPIVCNCSEKAMLLTVRKEGPNTGRQFYKCSKPQGAGCSFFLWADTQPAISESNWASGSQTAANNDRVKCKCGLPANKHTVQKEGNNIGREFYGCSKPRNKSCNFFQWVDENSIPGTQTNRVSMNNRNILPQNLGEKAKGKPRKCGICGNTGHNRKSCPNKT